jgi:carbon storage regulator
MLTLSRKPGESIRIGNDILIIVQEVRGKVVKISIDAPEDMTIYREELYKKIVAANLESTSVSDLADLEKELKNLPDF